MTRFKDVVERRRVQGCTKRAMNITGGHKISCHSNCEADSTRLVCRISSSSGTSKGSDPPRSFLKRLVQLLLTHAPASNPSIVIDHARGPKSYRIARLAQLRGERHILKANLQQDRHTNQPLCSAHIRKTLTTQRCLTTRRK